MKRNKFLQGPVLPIAAVALLAMSVVGSTRAAFTTQSETFYSQLETNRLSVALYEQTGGETEARKVEAAESDADGETVTSTAGTLKIVDLDEDEVFQIGRKYDEKLSVVNDGAYDEYVRVIVTKSWLNTENGEDAADASKNTMLDPDLITLGIVDESNWIAVSYGDNTSGRRNNEQTVYYYKYPLKANANDSQNSGETVTLIDSVMVKNDVTTEVTTSGLTGTITNSYDYDGKSFFIEVEVDAVQTHNAVDAINGAWGVDVTFEEDGTTIASIGNTKSVTTENESDEGGAQ
jgi:hypothetical protein